MVDLSRSLPVLEEALPSEARLRVRQSSSEEILVEVEMEELPSTALRLLTREATRKTYGSQGPVPVSVLETRTSSERDEHRRAGRSFIDLRGAVLIRAPGLYLDRDNLSTPPPPPTRGNRLDPYADGASRIVRTLLAHSRHRTWAVRELGEASGVHPSTASRVARELRDRDLLRDERPGERRRSRLAVPEPERLLEDWARSYRWGDNERLRVGAPVGSSERFVRRLQKDLSSDRWALTGPAGASLRAPHAAFDTIHVYLDTTTSLDLVARERGWPPSDSGKLCLVRPSYRESVWVGADTLEGVPVVSPVQLVLDLWHYPVRGREQARHLIDQVLQPIWEAVDGEG